MDARDNLHRTRRLAEAKVIRAARRLGLEVVRTRHRLGSPDNVGDFQIRDAATGTILAGPHYELSARAAAAWLANVAQSRRLFTVAARMRIVASEPVPASGYWLRGYPGG